MTPISSPTQTRALLLVGGVFNDQGGRPSGYFRKLAEALESTLGFPACRVVNGGTYTALRTELDAVQHVSHLFWFADVPNELPKLLPALKKRYPHLVLVQSKNNRRLAYSREQLFERMRQSQSHYLLEFTEAPDGTLLASLLSADEQVLLQQAPEVTAVAQAFATAFEAQNAPALP